MKRKIDLLLSEYGESHQNPKNKLIHWICVPFIFFSILGLLMSLPFFGQKSLPINWASLTFVLVLLYYLRLSFQLFLGFLIIGTIMVNLNYLIYSIMGENSIGLALVSFSIFAIAWIAQFIGHGIEGKKPSFLKDIQFLLIGPAWLLHFLFKKWNIKY